MGHRRRKPLPKPDAEAKLAEANIRKLLRVQVPPIRLPHAVPEEPEQMSNAASDDSDESEIEPGLSGHDCGDVPLLAGGNAPNQAGRTRTSHTDADQVFEKVSEPNSATASPRDGSAGLEESDSSTSETSSSPTAPTLSKPWASLFTHNREPKEGAKLELDEDSAGPCTFAFDDVAPISKAWGPTLIGYIAGRFPGRAAILKCCQGWGCKFSIHESGWLLFQFEDEESLNLVLGRGPYFIFQRPLLLKSIPPFFRFDNEELCQVPVWVRLRSLPLELWSSRCLSKILSRVGTPLRTDGLTATHGRSSYARALVEINASHDLVREVEIVLPNGCSFRQEVTYEFVPEYCPKCNSIGHKPSKCKYTPADASTARTNADPSAPPPALTALNSKLPDSMLDHSSLPRKDPPGLHSKKPALAKDLNMNLLETSQLFASGPDLDQQNREAASFPAANMNVLGASQPSAPGLDFVQQHPEAAPIPADAGGAAVVQPSSKPRKVKKAASAVLGLPAVEISFKGKEVAASDAPFRSSSRKPSSKSAKIGGSLPPVSS